MECPNCEFQNIPGSRGCVRCGSLLDLSGLSVEPPRAAATAVGRVAERTARRTRAAASRAGRIALRRRPAARMLPSASTSLLLLAAVPGLAQWRRGNKRLARGIVVAWSIAVLLAIYFHGTFLGWCAAMAILGIHSASVSLLLMNDLERLSLPRRAFVGLGISLTLLVTVYFPTWWFISGFARLAPMSSVVDGDWLSQGDLFVTSGRWTTQRDAIPRSAIVLYEIPPMGGGALVIQRTRNIERIIGVPGDTIEFRENRIIVNGVELEGPVAPLRDPSSLTGVWTVPPNHYALLPPLELWGRQRGVGVMRDDLRNLSRSAVLVPQERIAGRLLARMRPLGAPIVPQRAEPEPAAPAAEDAP